jgi:RNA polymerase sigma-70 factor (ECF subfamily)
MGEQDIDLALVRRVQRGEKAAFNLLVRRYQQKLSSLVSRYVSTQADVSDVVQEAFIKAYRALPNFRGESAFYTWLYRIAVNSAKNYITAQSRRPHTTDVDAEDPEIYEGNSALREDASPESLLLSGEIKKAIFATIDELPEELRVAITLREIEGMSYEEIASVMECPVGTVRSRIFRARDAIDTRIKPLLSG